MTYTFFRYIVLFFAIIIPAHAADQPSKKPKTDAMQLFQEWEKGTRAELTFTDISSTIRKSINGSFFKNPGARKDRKVGVADSMKATLEAVFGQNAQEKETEIINLIKNATVLVNQSGKSGKDDLLHHKNTCIWVYNHIDKSKIILLQNEQQPGLFFMIGYYPAASSNPAYPQFLSDWERFFVQHSSRKGLVQEAYKGLIEGIQ
jgi:hypothetical protein